MADDTAQNTGKNRKGGGRSQTLTELLSGVLEPVLARKTGMKLDLVRAWPEVIGPEFSKVTRPEKINWPRRKGDEDAFEPGILLVACEPSAALFFQHQQSQLIERINMYFGFQAIARVKILQKPVLSVNPSSKAEKAELSSLQVGRLSDLVAGVEDPELRATLEKLGKGVLSTRSQ